jgi:hypothetical protein
MGVSAHAVINTGWWTTSGPSDRVDQANEATEHRHDQADLDIGRSS